MSDDVPFRILPRITERNRHFWHGGAEGELRFLRCPECRTWVHPPQPLCPRCHARGLAPEAVSGRATVATYTVNHQQWMPGPEVPFVVAIVEIEEDPTVRLTTNLVRCPPDRVEVGMRVQVTFEHHDDPADPEGPGVWIPLFEPVDAEVGA